MFTGLIEEIGKLALIENIPGGKRIKIYASKILCDAKVDDSICVNGVCLTVTRYENDHFWVDAVGDTLDKTTISKLRTGAELNLERALRLSDRLGGHILQGHANGIGSVTQITKLGENYFMEITVPAEFEKYIIQEGSIAVDGISLTIARLNGNKVGLSVIPHTWNGTNLKSRKIGDNVNIEVDIIAKYVEKLLTGKKENNNLNENWLKEIGY